MNDSGAVNLRTAPETHNTQYLEAMARYNFVRRFIDGGSLLDAACAFGYGTDHLADRTDKAVGIDFEFDVLVWAKKHYRKNNIVFVVSDVTEICFSDRSFDAVCFFEAVHQIQDYRKALRELHRVLRPGGRLFISTVCGSKNAVGDAAHLHSFTPNSMGEALKESGFNDADFYGIIRPEEAYILEEKLSAVRRLDIMGIKRFIPRSIVSALVYFISKIAHIAPPQKFGYDAFRISKDAAGKGGLFVTCVKAE